MPRTAKPKPDKLADLRLEAKRVLNAALELEAEQADEETSYRAQELFYGTADLSQEGAKIRRYLKAVRTNPNNPDALSALAGFVGGTSQEQTEIYKKIVLAGERDLGKQAFKELKGTFWGFIETRPYMRAKHQLAQLYEQNQNFPAAIKEYEEMLELNPNDNQGVRYSLLGHYLLLEKLEVARKLWKQYEDEHSAFWAWGLVLLDFLSNKLEAAAKALAKARKVNSYAESYLGGWKPLPKELPPYYSPGQESEAIVCFIEIGSAWVRHPEAQKWLEKN